MTISELGRGAYGVVEKVRHNQSGTIMAVKVSRAPRWPSPAQPSPARELWARGHLGGFLEEARGLSLWYGPWVPLGAPSPPARGGGWSPSAAWPLNRSPLSRSGSGPP